MENGIVIGHLITGSGVLRPEPMTLNRGEGWVERWRGKGEKRTFCIDRGDATGPAELAYTLLVSC